MAKKLPKSMGACADLLFDTREQRLALQKQVDELQAQETALKNHIIDNLDKESTGAAGKHHMVKVTRKKKLRINPEKWNDFYKWVAKNGAFDTLQKRLNEVAIKERAENARRPIPGVEPFDYVDVSLTKI